MPEGLSEEDHDFNNKIAKDALMIVRIQPADIKDKRELEWSYDGIVAFSKICTHVGCPISLYEQQTHHVLCPCHQSTFDLSDGARVIFGPAGHALPQLRIGVNGKGNLEALGDFEEPVGPAFWERG
jgi:ubiquinol-cytochrome c reductase iron-sulfur subunit